MAQIRINHKYDVPAQSQPTHNVGQYVRKINTDAGTGQIIAINHVTALAPQTNRIIHQRSYTVAWLHKTKIEWTIEAENDIATSARSVPKFDTLEAAQEWMETQLNPGNWTAAAQDLTDSASDFDIALQKFIKDTDK